MAPALCSLWGTYSLTLICFALIVIRCSWSANSIVLLILQPTEHRVPSRWFPENALPTGPPDLPLQLSDSPRPWINLGGDRLALIRSRKDIPSIIGTVVRRFMKSHAKSVGRADANIVAWRVERPYKPVWIGVLQHFHSCYRYARGI